jgi:hypothetical protein
MKGKQRGEGRMEDDRKAGRRRQNGNDRKAGKRRQNEV